jgi:hypothetical protein
MSSVRSGMSIGIVLMLILSSLLIVWSASKAEAQTTTTDCLEHLEPLRGAIAAAEFTNPKDQSSLDAKVTAAETKLGQGKTADAAQKVTDIQTAVNRLAAEGKLADASAINTAINDALGCLNSQTGV